MQSTSVGMEVDCISFDTTSHKLDFDDVSINTNVQLNILNLKTDKPCCHSVVVKEVPNDKRELVGNKILSLMKFSRGLDHVCAFRGTTQHNGHFYYLMDWLTTTLKYEIEHSPRCLSVEKIVRYGRDITRGISELHDVNIVCMDVQPSNIFLDKKGNAFISDFGLASILSPTPTPEQTKYAAPETWGQSNGNEPSPQSPKSDMWSLGCTILEMCTKYCLWDGLPTTQVYQFVKEKKLPIILSSLVEGPLLEIVDGCLKFDQEERLSIWQIKKKFLNHARNPITLLSDPQIVKTDETLKYKLESLHSCIREDNVEHARLVLCESKDLDRLLNEEVEEFSAVFVACQMGSTKCLTELLNAGANANTIDKQGNSVLHITIQRDHTDCALLIVQHKGSMKLNSNNMTPLDLCIEMRNTKLLEKWIEVTTENEREALHICGPCGTPLCMAAAGVKNEDDKEGLALVKLLLKAGARRSGVDAEGQTPLHIAAMKDDRRLMEILLEGDGASDMNVRNFRERTPLHVALQHGARSCIGLLLERGADYTLKDDRGENALHAHHMLRLQQP